MEAATRESVRLAAIEMGVARDALTRARDEVGRGPGGRALSIALTELESALLWAQEALTREGKGVLDG